MALAASRLARVEDTLDELELLSTPGPLVQGILEQVTRSILEERDRLAALCSAARSSALVPVAARRVLEDVSSEPEDASLASPGLDPARVVEHEGSHLSVRVGAEELCCFRSELRGAGQFEQYAHVVFGHRPSFVSVVRDCDCPASQLKRPHQEGGPAAADPPSWFSACQFWAAR